MDSPELAVVRFDQLDVVHADLTFAADAVVRRLGRGFNSRAYQVDDTVLKVSRGMYSKNGAYRHLWTLEGEQALLSPYVGEYIPPTNYLVAPSEQAPDRHRVVAVQPYIGGLSMANFHASPKADRSQLVDFLECCLRMYRKTGYAPDIANIQTGFDIFRNHNVVISDSPATDGKPHLVDTNFGRFQRSKTFGPLWHRQIANGAHRGLAAIRAA